MSGNGNGNGWRVSSQSYHLQQTEYFPFVCCWCQQSFMEIEALITHHEAHLILLQDQVHTYYSTTFFRPQRGGNSLSMNPFRPLPPMTAETTTTIRAVAASSSSVGQFSLPYHQPAAGSSAVQSNLLLLGGNNVTSRQHQRGIDKWPMNVTSRQHPVRPSQQISRQGLVGGRNSRAVARGQREMRPRPAVDELRGQIRGPTNVVTRPLVEVFDHPEQVATDQHEEGNEALDLTLSLKTSYK